MNIPLMPGERSHSDTGESEETSVDIYLFHFATRRRRRSVDLIVTYGLEFSWRLEINVTKCVCSCACFRKVVQTKREAFFEEKKTPRVVLEKQ